MAYSNLKPGDEITIHASVSFSQDSADLSSLICLAPDTLEQMKTASIEQEEAVYQKLCTATGEWVKHAEETLRIEKAMEYLRTPAVEHTSNLWTARDTDRWEISNQVYKMTYHIYARTTYDHALKESVPVAWEVTWRVFFNASCKHYYGESSIAGQQSKVYGNKAEAEKYLKGRMDAYADLFFELSPPIPSDKKSLFSVNGQLLPGYTVKQDWEAVVAELPPEQPVERPPPKTTTKLTARKLPGRFAPGR